MTRLLVLGGTRHVGRAAVDDALARGWDVTVVNRGLGRQEPAGVHVLRADRTHSGSLAAALHGLPPWDLVLDTWSGAPRIVAEAARLLAPSAERYAYVSSVSVYEWPWQPGMDESAPVVAADPSADTTDYAADKRGAELAVLSAFGEGRSLLARAGLILGPYEVTGRLPWWFHRLAEGGDVLAPGPPDRPLQYVDGRDLAAWLLGASAAGVTGAVNTVGPPGITTMGDLLATAIDVSGSPADLRWLTPKQVEQTGLEPWTELPIWAPPTGEVAAIHAIGVQRALDLGLSCRPAGQTVADTWAWIEDEGYPESVRAGTIGIDRARERAALDLLT